MKVYLANPPFLPHFGRGARWQDTGRGGTLYYPIWLSYATGALGREHEVRLVDAPAWDWGREELVSDAAAFHPDMVVLDTSFPSLGNDLSVARSVKKRCPDATIVAVGPPASVAADRMLSEGADIVARWEYDFTLCELAEVLGDGRSPADVAGISLKDQGRPVHNPDRPFSTSADLDTLPFVSQVYHRHLRLRDYFLGQSLYPEVQIFTGRGCPNRCSFCAWPQTLMGRKYRVRSIENVLDEVAWIEENLGVREVFFEDDTFTISRSRVQNFCKGYRERGLSVPWSCNARADTLDLKTMREMKNSGCRLLISGYESGSDEVLKAISKGFDTATIRQFARNARESGLMVHGDVIIGLPGETRETIAKTRELVMETRPDILQVAVASPFPGTAFYDWCLEHGYLSVSDPECYLDAEGHQQAVISYPELTAAEMVQAADRLLRDYYWPPRYFPLALRQVLRRGGVAEARRLFYSAWMFLRYLHCRPEPE